MESIRRGVFETNSSSTHSLSICSESGYEKWKNGELLHHRWNNVFKTKEQILEDAKKRRKEYLEKQINGAVLYNFQEKYINANTDEILLKLEIDKEDWKTYDEYWDYIGYDYETFETTYTTEKGEKIIAFGYYGYDG